MYRFSPPPGGSDEAAVVLEVAERYAGSASDSGQGMNSDQHSADGKHEVARRARHVEGQPKSG